MHCEKQIQQLNLVVDLLCCPTAEPHQMLMLQWHGPHHVELSRLCLCLVCESVQTWSKLACLRLQLLWRWGQVIVSILNVKTCKEFFKKRILGNYWQYTLLQKSNNIIEGWLLDAILLLGSIHTCNLLRMNYFANYSRNNGLYCTKWAHIHSVFCQLLMDWENSIMGCVPFFFFFFAIACTE